MLTNDLIHREPPNTRPNIYNSKPTWKNFPSLFIFKVLMCFDTLVMFCFGFPKVSDALKLRFMSFSLLFFFTKVKGLQGNVWIVLFKGLTN